jgi:hypothetical protein
MLTCTAIEEFEKGISLKDAPYQDNLPNYTNGSFAHLYVCRFNVV